MARFGSQDHAASTSGLPPTSDIQDKAGNVSSRPRYPIRYRDRRGSDTKVEPVLVADMVVVGTPTLTGKQEITDPAVLVDLPWLQEYGTIDIIG